MSQARQKSGQDIEHLKQETTEIEHAKLLRQVKWLSAKIDEYLDRYPMVDDAEPPATIKDKSGLNPSYKANKPKRHSAVESELNQRTGHRVICSTINSTPLPPSDDPHTTRDLEERPKRLQNPHENDQTASKVRKTSKQDEDILNADFIAL